MKPISLNQTTFNQTNNIISFIQQGDKDMTAFSNSSNKESAAAYRKNSATDQNKITNLKACANKSGDYFLSMENTKKMIMHFLTGNKISKEKLAEALGITVDNLESLLSGKSNELIPKINLPLIKLYCKTKFNNPG